ncbi:MAG: hypothetical protein NTW10_01550 [Bacteroidetes bacterium]|nr:hypothetical protein [Bacteroidota bacterium]
MEAPDWLDKTKIKITLDALPILASGEHPLQRVVEECATLQTGEIYEIITPFAPMPMIEKLSAQGFGNFTETTDDGLYHTYFMKPLFR